MIGFMPHWNDRRFEMALYCSKTHNFKTNNSILNGVLGGKIKVAFSFGKTLFLKKMLDCGRCTADQSVSGYRYAYIRIIMVSFNETGMVQCLSIVHLCALLNIRRMFLLMHMNLI